MYAHLYGGRMAALRQCVEYLVRLSGDGYRIEATVRENQLTHLALQLIEESPLSSSGRGLN